MRIAVVLSAAWLLAGCNSVVSTTPLFSARDAEGQPQLRSGVWSDENAPCEFDHRKPVSEWPGCSTGWVVRPDGVVTTFAGVDPPRPGETRYRFMLAKGDPAVMQVTLDDGSGPTPTYAYMGLKPLKLDAQGRVIEYKMWLALCGPPPPDPTGEHDSTTTREPIGGLVMDASKHDCVASAQGPVQESVRRSEAWSGDDNQGRDRARWIRDGER